MKSYYFAAQSDDRSAVLWTADVAVGTSAADQRAAAAAARRAVTDSNFYFKKRNWDVSLFRANCLQNCPEIPHFQLSAPKLLQILKGAANVADVENLSPSAFRRRLQTAVDSHTLSPAERDRIIININKSKVWIKKSL